MSKRQAVRVVISKLDQLLENAVKGLCLVVVRKVRLNNRGIGDAIASPIHHNGEVALDCIYVSIIHLPTGDGLLRWHYGILQS